MKKIYFFYFLLVLPFVLQAQFSAVDGKFKGEWTFDHALVYEKPRGSSDESIVKSRLTYEEFYKDVRYSEVPTRISFYEAFDGLIATEFVQQNVSPMLDENQRLVFSVFDTSGEPTAEGDYPVLFVGPAFSYLSLGVELMNMRYDYTYRNEQNQETEGYLTLLYRRK